MSLAVENATVSEYFLRLAPWLCSGKIRRVSGKILGHGVIPYGQGHFDVAPKKVVVRSVKIW